MPENVIAYWLLPSEPARDFLADVIGELAARFDAPTFEPHLTLFIAPKSSATPSEVLGDLPSVTITLNAVEIAHSQKFTKTLFVQFEKSEALQELADAVRRLSGTADRYVLDPHLSLLYKQLPPETRQHLAYAIQLPHRQMQFKSICAVRCPSPTESAQDVRDWHLLANQNSNTR